MTTTDISIYDQVVLGGQYDFDLPFLPGTVVDAGANIGMASIYYANKYRDAKIIAVEAEASNFAILTHNVRPYPNILAIDAALWNREGEISSAAPSALDCACCKVGFGVSEGKGVPVRGVTMRTLMRSHRFTPSTCSRLTSKELKRKSLSLVIGSRTFPVS
jgi:FkbM family methyltransferase